MLSADATVHPALQMTRVWPGPEGYPGQAAGAPCWTREGLLCPTGPGQLVCTWTTGGFCEPAPGNHTMSARSLDHGVTWTPPAVLFRHPHRGLFTTELFAPHPGEVHAFLQTYPFGSWMAHLSSYRAVSTDGGVTWTPPRSIPGGVDNVWVNKGIRLSSGRWVLPVSWAELTGDEWCEPAHGRPPLAGVAGGRPLVPQEVPYMSEAMVRYRAGNAWCDRNHRYCCGVLLSDDDGASFRRCGYVRGGVHGWLIEPRVVELRDGRLAMLIRSQRDGRLWRSDSTDAGETWSPAWRTDIPNPAAKVCLLRSSTGRIYLLHNPTGGDGDIMLGRNPLSLWVSDDDLATWTVKLDLVRDPNPRQSLNYPDGFLDEANGQLVFVWEDTHTVFLAKLPLDACRG